jgi:hypothetical protein
VVLTNLETHIFINPSTFHGLTNGNHDLKIIDSTDIEINFLGNATMNKIMGASTIKKNDDLPMFNVTNYLEGLGSREASEPKSQRPSNSSREFLSPIGYFSAISSSRIGRSGLAIS